MATSQTMKTGAGGLLKLFIIWPFTLGWLMATKFADRTGILATLVAGLALMMVGWLLCSSIIGILIGLPMAFFGLLLLLRALY